MGTDGEVVPGPRFSPSDFRFRTFSLNPEPALQISFDKLCTRYENADVPPGPRRFVPPPVIVDARVGVMDDLFRPSLGKHQIKEQYNRIQQKHGW